MIVAADGGANAALRSGVRPDVIIGDLDSILPETREKFRGVRMVRVTRQDNTDLEKALDFISASGPAAVAVAGATGGRIDFTIGNLSVFWKYTRALGITFVGDGWRAFPALGRRAVNAPPGTTVSLLPFGTCGGITLRGLRYPLTDAEMRTALQRGARATGRELLWRTERGRPFAERRSVGAAASSSAGRDVRLILLAAPHLVVVTPPAYRGVILRSRPPRRAGGAAENFDGGAPDGKAGSGGTGGGDGNGADPENNDSWAGLLGRIDAEDSVMPNDAVAMLSVVDLFSARGAQSAVGVGAGRRGSVDGEARGGEDRASGATVFGLPVPRVLTATLGVAPQPFATIDAELEVEADAIRWEREWPGLRQKLLTNPLVVLTGFSGLVARATLERTAAVVRLRIDATELETTRLLQLAASQLSALRP